MTMPPTAGPPPTPPVVLVIGLIIGGIEIALLLADQMGWEWRRLALVHLAYWPPLLGGDWPPLYPGQAVVMQLSYALLHGGGLHMAMNTVILLAVGRRLALQMGSGRFVGLVVLSALGGGVVYGALATAPEPMVGASGVVFGLFGAWKAIEWRARQRVGAPLAPVLTFVGGLVALNVILLLALGGYLAWQAHLGGFLAGWAFGLLLAGPPHRRFTGQG